MGFPYAVVLLYWHCHKLAFAREARYETTGLCVCVCIPQACLIVRVTQIQSSLLYSDLAVTHSIAG